MKAADKVLVVTGAGSGIGRAVALEALRRRARVAAVDLNPTTLDETASLAAAGDRLTTHVVNITDKAAVAALPADVAARHGAVDGLCPCSTASRPPPVTVSTPLLGATPTGPCPWAMRLVTT